MLLGAPVAPQAPAGFIAWGFSVCVHSIRASLPVSAQDAELSILLKEEGFYGTQWVGVPVSRGRQPGRGWGSRCRDRLWQRRQLQRFMGFLQPLLPQPCARPVPTGDMLGAATQRPL